MEIALKLVVVALVAAAQLQLVLTRWYGGLTWWLDVD